MRIQNFIGPVLAATMVVSAIAQSPTPIVVQAITPAAISAPAANPAAQAGSKQSPMTILQELKAANEAILAKQKAALVQLEELEKAAEQIKIYSKRN